ncbi:HIT family protein [Cryptosporangium aurantiacum]|uniref:Diadenosine tetraphosphate (Ap4A) hydrolase n=1 Tax=Cryptosporangium aurantiacum TaxID=134849 RepID=A0A1M7L7M2_9ACTN|nr:HIT family protein [Cryptosporangium aurantiacum]SHM73375.1 Diadenosine tetraphosphate (Ap4A) hydrolase [Cryptosporangium aurantiacum]
MATIFTRIINGELPGRFVWQDEHAVGFLSIAPIRPGHTLVVPRQEIDQWTDAPAELITHLTTVTQTIGQAVKEAWDAPRAALIIAGFEVPHLHLHTFPVWGLDDFHFEKADPNPDPAAMDEAAERIRATLEKNGYGAQAR